LETFEDFVQGLVNILNIKQDIEKLTISEQQRIISKINEYLYTNYEGIGTTNTLDEDFVYLSDFHIYWEKNHEKILNPQIDKTKCEAAADILHQIYKEYGEKPFIELYDTYKLSPEEVCKIRFLTANQDFRGSREFKLLAKIYSSDPSIFDMQFIYEQPEIFLSKLKMGKLSQSDKRVKYAKTTANFLLEKEIEPFELFQYYNNDFQKLRTHLADLKGSGYGQKKVDMFLRDMHLLGIWEKGKNFDKIDVASDINTIKVALRTGILKTDILLLSSFLDIFCYQYGLMDYYTAKAWRKVWEIWHEKYPKETVESPSQIDYLIYRLIGKEFCKERLFLFRCTKYNHEFFWHTGRNKTCQICYKKDKKRIFAKLIFRDLPCKFKEGKIAIIKNNVRDVILPNIEECPFISVCNPREDSFKKLNPPKSISILGRTGWTTAYTKKDEGGGGLMA